MTVAEIRKQIREARREMKVMGVRKICCLNGGLSPLEYTWNNRLMQLNLRLETAIRLKEQEDVLSK